MTAAADPTTGNLGPSTDYDPWGAPTTTATAPTPLGFQAGYTDPDTGLVDAHARWYDPTLGAFTSRDTLTLKPGPVAQPNRYLYANASPLNGIDDDGHMQYCSECGGWGTTEEQLHALGKVPIPQPGRGHLPKDATVQVSKNGVVWSHYTEPVPNGGTKTWDCFDGVCFDSRNLPDPRKLLNSIDNWIDHSGMPAGVGARTKDQIYSTLYGACYNNSHLLCEAGDLQQLLFYSTVYGNMYNRHLSFQDAVEEYETLSASGGVGIAVPEAISKSIGGIKNTGADFKSGTGIVDDGTEPLESPGDFAREGKGCSFTADTPVLLADGQHTSKISSIRPGDLVRATDVATGTTSARVVTATHTDQDTSLADVEVTVDGTPDTIHTTPNHQFWVDTYGDWRSAADLRPGDRLHTPDEKSATVTVVRTFEGAADMHTLTVQGTHTYYVLAGNTPVLVHNAGPAGCGKPVNLPAWKTIDIDVDHIVDNHTAGGKTYQQSGIKDKFPDYMSPDTIESTVRQAYRNSTMAGPSQGDRVFLRGDADGMTIEMWVNKTTGAIETAYPIGRSS